MYFTIYKDFLEFPILILSDYNIEDTSVWEREWEKDEDYHSDNKSVLIGLGSASTGDMLDDPMVIFVSKTINLGKNTNKDLKLEDFEYLLFDGVIELGSEKTLQININESIFIGHSSIDVKIWGNKNRDKRKDLYVEIENIL